MDMIRKLKLIPFIIFSLLFIGAVPLAQSEEYSSFNKLEDKVIKECDFIQNGVKMEYCSKESLEYEYARLAETLKKNIKSNLQLEQNKIIYKDLEREISVNIWSEGSKTKVEVIYLNNLNTKNSFDLNKELAKLQNKKSMQVRYFSFIKGKIKSSDRNYVQEILNNEVKEGTLESLDIHNGYVAKAKLKDNQKINLSYVRYNTGEYIVVGTPMIFITY
ncbi:hypothetical protein CCH01_23030 [Clostridium chauvoei JF4335]|uniref:TATA-box binding protein n=2 Tax=Clostridium chauvoei TaxID=46867 RepID=A0A1U6JPL0_9CLOT|nr:hypothetical protein C6H62_11295 [Clostridium chauvoei]SLK22229.1 hypothetical protein CCH01_23030 [Clostridium chauvoei JF4335]